MTRAGSKPRRAGALLLGALLSACNVTPTLSMTPAARVGHRMTEGDRWVGDAAPTSIGGGLDLRWHPWAETSGFGQGMAFGVEESWMPAMAHTALGRRENLLLGWGHTPRQPGSGPELGAELTLIPAGWGHIYYAGEVESSFTLGGRMAGMLKLPCLANECGEGLWAYRWLLLVEAGWNAHLPYRVHDAPWLGELMGTVGLRLDLSLLP